ncbi:hypothetical protein BWI96_01295 [Siphonobacter sp. SORGH_AS_0500]|uniref:hypothetical protein n=1 Tax=Siphonobacter sp. SORGH_AS_0500 TaxID=1864824 RepID=UPI000CB563F3|nr:hypothetical protein [Siphonobacter sp. SORGH_AS_0500]PKK38438.1 hypothetical protein BWI96_01295 [Siphonobacter sp. SORGH_AS_0500]
MDQYAKWHEHRYEAEKPACETAFRIYAFSRSGDETQVFNGLVEDRIPKGCDPVWVLTQNFTPETVDQIETLTGKVEQNGKQKILMYMAFAANNQYYLARIVTEPDQKMYSPYLSQVAAHFLRLANSEGVNVPALPQDQAKDTQELKEVLQNY